MNANEHECRIENLYLSATQVQRFAASLYLIRVLSVDSRLDSPLVYRGTWEVPGQELIPICKLQSQNAACFAEIEPGPSRPKLRRVAIAEVAEKIRFHMPGGEKLLHAFLALAGRKELFIEF